MKIYKFVYPFMPLRDEFAKYCQNLDFKIRRDHQKYFLWGLRLWVGRRKEPILGYVLKNDEKKNSGSKGVIQNLVHIYIKTAVKEFMYIYKKGMHICIKYHFGITYTYIGTHKLSLSHTNLHFYPLKKLKKLGKTLNFNLKWIKKSLATIMLDNRKSID